MIPLGFIFSVPMSSVMVIAHDILYFTYGPLYVLDKGLLNEQINNLLSIQMKIYIMVDVSLCANWLVCQLSTCQYLESFSYCVYSPQIISHILIIRATTSEHDPQISFTYPRYFSQVPDQLSSCLLNISIWVFINYFICNTSILELISILTFQICFSAFPFPKNATTVYLILQFIIWMSSLIPPSFSSPTFNQLLKQVDFIVLMSLQFVNFFFFSQCGMEWSVFIINFFIILY